MCRARATLAGVAHGALPPEPFTLEQSAASSPPLSPSSSTEALTTGAPGCALRTGSPPSLPDSPAATGFGSNDPLSDTSTVTWAAMSAIFEGYEKELQELSSAITRKAAQIPTLTRGA